MSMTTAADTHDQAEDGALATITAALKRLGTAYANWRLEREAIATLSAMSERDLADLGLSRSDIVSAVRGDSR